MRKTQKKVLEEVRTRRLVLVDHEDREIGELLSDAKGVKFCLKDAKGLKRFSVSVEKDITVVRIARPNRGGAVQIEAGQTFANVGLLEGRKTAAYIVTGEGGSTLALSCPGSGKHVSLSAMSHMSLLLISDCHAQPAVQLVTHHDDGPVLLEMKGPTEQSETEEVESEQKPITVKLSVDDEKGSLLIEGPDEKCSELYLTYDKETQHSDCAGLFLRAGLEAGAAELEIDGNGPHLGLYDESGRPRVFMFYSTEIDYADLDFHNNENFGEDEETSARNSCENSATGETVGLVTTRNKTDPEECDA